MAERSIADGSAYGKLRILVQAQGGDVAYIDDPSKFPKAMYIEDVKSPQSGYLSEIQARTVGEASVTLGAGRAKKSDPVDHAVGFLIHHKVGDRVDAGDLLFTIHANEKARLSEARDAVLGAHQFSESPVQKLPLFYN